MLTAYNVKDYVKVKTFRNVDANTAFETPALEAGKFNDISMFVIGESGTHTTHKIELFKCDSGDGTFEATGDVQTGEGNMLNKNITENFVKAKGVLNEGGASTVDIIILAK